MARTVPTAESLSAIDINYLVPVLDPATNDPLAYTISSLVRAIFTITYESKLVGIQSGAQRNLAVQRCRPLSTRRSDRRSGGPAHTMLRTAVQVRDLLDGLLGTGWRTGGGTSGSGGISLDQAIDGVGAALAMLAQFTYDPAANTFTFALPPNSVTVAQAELGTEAQKRDWRGGMLAAHISAGNDLPTLDSVNVGDVRIIGGNPSAGLSFVDITDPTMVLTTRPPV